MRPSTRLSSLALCVWHLGLGQAQVHLPFTHQPGHLNTLLGRDSNPSEALWRGDYLFVVNATFGTPGQDVSLVISPSVADTWVPSPDSCQYTTYTSGNDYSGDYSYSHTTVDLCAWGSYNTSLSSTFEQANQKYQDWYVTCPDGTHVSGENVTDTLNIGDVELENFPFGVAPQSSRFVGVLGLGSNSSYYGPEYANFPDRLLRQGLISTKAYSVWLDDEEGTSGSLLLGAVDTSRFEGSLTRLYAYGSYYGAFGVTVQSINASDADSGDLEALGGNDFPFDASVGHGEIFSNFPDATAKKIWSRAGASYNGSIDLATIPCDAASDAGDASLLTVQVGGDGGPVLDVRLKDLILPQSVASPFWQMSLSYNYEHLGAPAGLCLFAVQNGSLWGYSSSSSGYFSLSASMLRRLYVVYDLVNDEIAIAPVKFGATETSNVVAFESYGASVPSSTAYCGTSSYCSTGSGSGSSGDGSSSGSGSGSSGYGSSSSSYYKSSSSLIIGLSVAFGVLALAALAVALFLWRKICCGPRDKLGKGVDADADPEGANPSGSAPVPPLDPQMTEARGAQSQPVQPTTGPAAAGAAPVSEHRAGEA